MTSKIHKTASLIATVCIATFFTSTLLVEVFGSEDMVAFVKSLIVMPGIFISPILIISAIFLKEVERVG